MSAQLASAHITMARRLHPSPTEFRAGMAHLTAAVSLVTTDGPAGRGGFTVTSVTSVTDSPPTLLVCVNRSASAHGKVLGNGVLAVNTLAATDEALARIFAGATRGDARFEAASWSVGRSGAPLLDGALVSFDCRLQSVTPVGTHDILICDVLGVTLGSPDAALLYRDRAYRTLPG